MMWGSWFPGRWGWGGMGIGMLGGGLLWIVAIWLLIRAFRGQGWSHSGSRNYEDDAMAILRRRLASGEITNEEYERVKVTLSTDERRR